MRLAGLLVLASSFVAACAGPAEEETSVADGAALSERELPADLRAATLVVRAAPDGRPALGILLAQGIAYAPGVDASGAPVVTTADGAPVASPLVAAVDVGGERFGVLLDYARLPSNGRTRLFFRVPARRLAPSPVGVGTSCIALGADRVSGAIVAESGTVTAARDGKIVLETEEGGDGAPTLLACGGKLAGLRAGAPGKRQVYRAPTQALLDAFTKAWTARME